MTIDQGMNVAEVESLASSLAAAAQQLASAAAQLDRSVDVAAWRGPVATQFSRHWWPKHRATLLRLSAEISGFGKVAAANARDQLRASGDQAGFTKQLPGAFALMINQHPQEPTIRVSSFTGILERGQALPPGEFEIMKVNEVPPRYIVNLRGIDISALNQAHLQDLPTATAARLAGTDAYAQRVEQELQRAGVPAGAEVMLVGHSYGAIAAMDIARDRAFNQPGNASADGAYHVQVTHVLAAGAGLRDEVSAPPPGTNVLLAVNRNDLVAAGIQVAHPTSPPDLSPVGVARDVGSFGAHVVEGSKGWVEPHSVEVSPGRAVYEFNESVKPPYHDYANYTKGLAAADGPATRWMDDAAHRYFAGGGGMQVTRVSVPDSVDYSPIGG